MDRVCYFEVPYSEKQRMESFYSKVFGWQFQTIPGDQEYAFAFTTEVDQQFQPKEKGGINGGAYPRGEHASKTPLIVIEVESCEQRMQDVKDAGGAIVLGPHQVGNMGIYAQVKDSEDNIIGLWQPLRGDGQQT